MKNNKLTDAPGRDTGDAVPAEPCVAVGFASIHPDDDSDELLRLDGAKDVSVNDAPNDSASTIRSPYARQAARVSKRGTEQTSSAKQVVERIPSRRSRFQGCLLGGASGDALGAPLEFYTLAEITKKFGSHGLREFFPCYERLGAITDDTQMTLFTAEGLIRAAVRYESRGICHPPSVIHSAYLRWLRTQGRSAPRAATEDGWLINVKDLWANRAPGATCISALSATTELGATAMNDSKGCGGVMRVAPIGLLCEPERAFTLAMEAAALTHGHPTSSTSAGVLAYLIAAIKEGDSLQLAVDAAHARLRQCPNHEETLRAIDDACDLAASGTADASRLERLGGGWIAEEALGIALYCTLVRDSLEEAVILAVNHSGDSDSTGAITGNLAGVLYGEEMIPRRWLADLELRREIETVADDLLAVADGDVDLTSDSFVARYPGY